MTYRKRYPVFDCDAHINDPPEIWSDYVEPEYRDAVRATYWKDERRAILNGRTEVIGGENYDFLPSYNPICIAGPYMSKPIMRKLQQMRLTDEQRDYVEHKGAVDPHARLREMDLMGIDQVLVIPTMMIAHLPYAENADGVYGFARAYNSWVADWCKAASGRLFAAATLPLQSPRLAAAEVERAAGMGFPVGLVRPIDARGAYPNLIGRVARASGSSFQPVYRALEEAGMVLGMHAFPATESEPSDTVVSPGEYINRTGADTDRMVDSQTLSFVFEGMTWLVQALMSGFLDRFPKLKMAIFECNATWLVSMLERCDRHLKLYANERTARVKRLPSEAFYDQCVISFESDETPVYRQWDRYENIGIWASDCYHHDGADAWSAITEMERLEVPEPVQAKLMGGNARAFYGIEAKNFVDEAPESIERPDWFPQGPELDAWWQRESDPRKYGVTPLGR